MRTDPLNRSALTKHRFSIKTTTNVHSIEKRQMERYIFIIIVIHYSDFHVLNFIKIRPIFFKFIIQRTKASSRTGSTIKMNPLSLNFNEKYLKAQFKSHLAQVHYTLKSQELFGRRDPEGRRIIHEKKKGERLKRKGRS